MTSITINDHFDVDASLLINRCKLVKMLAERNQVNTLTLEYDNSIIQHLLDWLQNSKLNCKSIQEIEQFCQLADYLDISIHHFYCQFVKIMQKLGYTKIKYIIDYYLTYKDQLRTFDNLETMVDQCRPLRHRDEYKVKRKGITWLDIIEILNSNFIIRLDRIYYIHFTNLNILKKLHNTYQSVYENRPCLQNPQYKILLIEKETKLLNCSNEIRQSYDILESHWDLYGGYQVDWLSVMEKKINDGIKIYEDNLEKLKWCRRARIRV